MLSCPARQLLLYPNGLGSTCRRIACEWSEKQDLHTRHGCLVAECVHVTCWQPRVFPPPVVFVVHRRCSGHPQIDNHKTQASVTIPKELDLSPFCTDDCLPPYAHRPFNRERYPSNASRQMRPRRFPEEGPSSMSASAGFSRSGSSSGRRNSTSSVVSSVSSVAGSGAGNSGDDEKGGASTKVRVILCSYG